MVTWLTVSTLILSMVTKVSLDASSSIGCMVSSSSCMAATSSAVLRSYQERWTFKNSYNSNSNSEIIIIIIVGSCIALMSVIFDTPSAPDYYPGFSTAAILHSSISRN